MKQLIRMSLVAFGVLCRNADCTNAGVDVGFPISALEASGVNVLDCQAPMVHQYLLERLPDGNVTPRISMRVDSNSLPGGVGGIQAILASGNWNGANPNATVQGVNTPELWITVIPRSSVQSGDDEILFRPQWAFLDEWRNGNTVTGSPESYTSTFFNGGSVFRAYSGALSLHGDAVSPNCHPLPAAVQHGNGSFAVVYHTTYSPTREARGYTRPRDIYGVIVVCSDIDYRAFNGAVRGGSVLVDALRRISVVDESPQLMELFF